MKKILVLLFLFSSLVFAQSGNWNYTQSKDPLNDNDLSVIGLTSDGRAASMIVRCNGKDIDIFLVSNSYYLGRSNDLQVIYRFDSLPASSITNWTPSTTGTGAFMPLNQMPEFVKQGLSAQKLLIRIYDYNSVARDYYFSNWLGFETSLKKLPCATDLISASTNPK